MKIFEQKRKNGHKEHKEIKEKTFIPRIFYKKFFLISLCSLWLIIFLKYQYH